MAYVDDCVFCKENLSDKLSKKAIVYILGSSNYTFMQKTVVMAKLGLINNYVIRDTDLARALGCSQNNVWLKKMKLEGMISTAKSIVDHKQYKIDCKDLFDYIGFSSDIGLYFLNKLDEEEIKLIQYIWGEDFEKLQNISNINLTKQQILKYYSAVGKLHKFNKNINPEEVINGICIGNIFTKK